MTYPRCQLVPPGAPGTYHCVSRCVRRAFLCGQDAYSGRSFEHRRQWVEDRLQALAELFAVAVWGYAVMSNHLHLVVQLLPEVAAGWSDAEVAERWLRLFPRAEDTEALHQQRIQALTGQPERIAILRARLADLSWLMRCLSEPIARRANREDQCTGRFWEGRYHCQALLDDRAVLAAMAYADLNPVRARLCETLAEAAHTSAKRRLAEIEQTPAQSRSALGPIMGVSGRGVLGLNQAEYLQLLDWTGRQLHPGKHGVIDGPAPPTLARFGPNPQQWTRQVQAVGSDFHRAIGSVEQLLEKARAMGQRWLQGIGAARGLTAPEAI